MGGSIWGGSIWVVVYGGSIWGCNCREKREGGYVEGDIIEVYMT